MSAGDVWKLVPRAKRIVVKVGSSTLTRDGRLRPDKFTALARDVSRLLETGRQVIVVSSGAIAVGAHRLGWPDTGKSIPEKQAAAAVGQIGLVELYQRRFARLGHEVGQVLLTRAGLEERERFLNARRTMLMLLRLGVVPIVNENDTIATEEIRFGDNDNLAATIVNAVEADLLVILTDVDGLYERAPEAGQPRPPLIRTVEKITPAIERAASGTGTRFGSGGMVTKLQAAENAARSGTATVLCNGRTGSVLEKLVTGEQHGTLFAPGQRLRGHKHWLAFTAKTRGRIVIDDGAARALQDRGRSLLPAGILRIEGTFKIGDSVSCVNDRGDEVARGLVGYSSDEVGRLTGRATNEIARVLGYSNGKEIIHRDDLVLVRDS
ncbi:MAG: glutamate 5-kinase [Deltaproteobacteria bacterium]|jgi:glutamate 5-kinase|nr:glutamate 5-kinase [Deltaproteobacteria bacterium]